MLDEKLIATERSLIRNEGLPRRPWFRHQIYAPGYYTGYGVKTLPGVREAIEERNWKEAAEQVEIVSRTLDAMTEAINQAASVLKGVGK